MPNCRVFGDRWLQAGVAREMKRVAFTGTFEGMGLTPYLHRCFAYHQPTGSKIGFTRNTGHHSSGWFKNPDYERCFHLSLSFHDSETGEPAGRNERLTSDWLDLFYGDRKRLIWTEPPTGERGKALDTWHYRLFVHEDWLTPLLPRKEVYTREFTDVGWKSWSDVQAGIEQAESRLIEVVGNELA